MKLRDYQIKLSAQAAEVLEHKKIVYLAMEVRTGKTLTALNTAKLFGAKKVLFLTKKKAISSIQWDYDNFDFNYYPNPWQMTMVHVFGTQWSHWGSTFMINKETFEADTKYIKIIEHLSNLNFVKTKRAYASN